MLFFILGYFLRFYLPNSPKNQNKKKKRKKKAWRYHHFTIVYQKHDHMLHCSWDVVRDGYNYFSFWASFCPFTPLTARKIKILRKWKSTWRYHHFTQVYQKSWSYAILLLRYGAWQMATRGEIYEFDVSKEDWKN